MKKRKYIMTTRNAIVRDRNWKLARVRGAIKTLNTFSATLLNSSKDTEMYKLVLSGLEAKLVKGIEQEFNSKLVHLSGIVQNASEIAKKHYESHATSKHQLPANYRMPAANQSNFSVTA